MQGSADHSNDDCDPATAVSVLSRVTVVVQNMHFLDMNKGKSQTKIEPSKPTNKLIYTVVQKSVFADVFTSLHLLVPPPLHPLIQNVCVERDFLARSPLLSVCLSSPFSSCRTPLEDVMKMAV